jgi:HlyD family secretion protein
LVGGGVGAGVLSLAWVYLPPLISGSRNADLPLTAAAARGELRVTVPDRGELSSVDESAVECELEGGMAKLVTIVPEGTRVKKNDVVATLDTDTLMKALNEQRVKWELAETKVKTSQSDLVQAKSKQGTENAKAEKTFKLAKLALKKYLDPLGEFRKDQEKLKGALEEAKKQLVDAEEDLAFTRSQLKKGFGEVSTVKSKELGVQQMTNRRNSAEAELRVLERFTREESETKLQFEADDAEREVERTRDAQKSAVEKAESELKNAESTAKIEKQTLDRIQQQIDRCTIKAPSDGIVVYSNSRFWDESSRIRPGAQLYNRQPIFSLPDLSKMKVKMKIHESLVKKVKTGMSATLQLESLPGVTLNGTVRKIATIAQADGWRGGGVKQYETEIDITDLPSDAGLKPGMTAEVKILVNTIPDALQVPVSAVAEYDGQRVVYAVAGGKVVRRDVQVGETSEQFVQVTSGLESGEQVALDARSRAAADLKAAGQEAKPKVEPSTSAVAGASR